MSGKTIKAIFNNYYMMYKRKFSIDSRISSYIKEMSKNIGDDIVIIEKDLDHQGINYYFSSVHLNSIDDPQQVFEEAQKLKRIFD
jgi:hypothetical protein